MEKLTFEEFVDKFTPKLKDQYKTYLMSPEELIGKTCWSDRSGFGCGPEGGTKMVIDKIKDGKVNFKHPHDPQILGWQTSMDQLPFSIRWTEKRIS